MPSFLEVPSIISDQIPRRLYTIPFAHITLHIHYCAFLFTRIHAATFPHLWSGFCCAPELQQSLTITRTQTIEALITDERNQ